LRAAENEDEAAQLKLGELALANGASEEEVNQAPDWAGLAALAEPKTIGEFNNTPQVNDVFHYRPIDPKTKKPAKKPVGCQVVHVDGAKHTAVLQALDSGTQYKSIPWEQLEEIQ